MKKWIALLLSLVMIFSLTACSGVASAKSDQIDVPNSDQIGTVDTPVTVKIIIKDVFPDDENTQLLAKTISEKMAAQGQYVDIQFLEPPASSYASAMPLAVMNGEVKADLIYLQGGDKSLADQGLLTDLTPYLEKCTYIKQLMDDSNVAKMESYPYLLWLAPPRVSTPVVRTDWLEGVSSYDVLIADPTPENYLTFFKELKEVNGADYAFTMYGDLQKLDAFFNHAFGVTGTVVKENGIWIFSKASQAEKKKLAFYARLYAEGLLDPDFLTLTWDMVEQRFYEGDAAVIAGTAGGVIQVYDQKMMSLYGEDASLTVLPAASGVSHSYQSIDVTKESRGFAINIDSQVKDAAWAVLEFMASPEGRILDKVGLEGIHYTVEDNKILFTDAFNGWWAHFWDTTNNFAPQDPALAEPVLTAAAADSLDKVNKYMVMDTNMLLPQEYTPQWDAMSNLYNEYATDIVRGIKSIEAFDEFVQKWNEAGGNDMHDLLQETFG